MPAQTEIRPLRTDDWRTVPIAPGKYSNVETLAGFQRCDGYGGNPLHPASGDDAFEEVLAQSLKELRSADPAGPGFTVDRHHVRVPYWRGQMLPRTKDYALLSQPEPLKSTSVTVVLVPNRPGLADGLAFCFEGQALPSLRERMAASGFTGLVGNLGYFFTPALIDGYPWSHNVRYPRFKLRARPSYIGLHLEREEGSGRIVGSFPGAHPGAVGVRADGTLSILPSVPLDGYEVLLGPHAAARVSVQTINEPDSQADVVVFTPAFAGTKEIQGLVKAAETTGGADKGWQKCRPMVPFPAGSGRVNVFVANEGNGRLPVEKVVALWEGASPVPSFGAVLSFSRSYFSSLFGTAEGFRESVIGKPVRIFPHASVLDLEEYHQILGGLVPAVVDGVHALGEAGTVDGVMEVLGKVGATSPIAQCGRETRNFDPRIREPAGVLLQTATHMGWVLFDGRHELSVGASVVDIGVLLKKLDEEGALGGRVEQAIFVDGGSAMKVYHVSRNEGRLRLDLLTRVAAGSRNGPGSDPEGFNLYSTVRLRLNRRAAGKL